MEIVVIILKYLGWLAFVLGLPMFFARLSSVYVFKAKDWRAEVVMVFTLFWTFYVFNWNDVSFLGYVDWFLVKTVEIGLPFLLASYLNKRFFQNVWAYYLILCLLIVTNTFLVSFVLDYFGISVPKL